VAGFLTEPPVWWERRARSGDRPEQ